jgi:sugar lactone lactonase YvrE
MKMKNILFEHFSSKFYKRKFIFSILQTNLTFESFRFSFLFHHFDLLLEIKWKQQGITVAGGNGGGDGLNQLFLPQDIFIDDDQTIYIADGVNHRIVEWKSNAKEGQIIAGENGKGNKTNQLNGPTNVIIDKGTNSLIISDSGNKRIMRWSRQNNTDGQIIISDTRCFGLSMDKNGYLYVSDIDKHEVRRWKIGDQNGTIVAGGNGEGDRLNQLNRPSFIFVDEDYSLYVSDWGNHRVMKWIKDASEGIVVAGGNGLGNSFRQLFYPQGLIVDQFGQIYVADSANNRVMRWCEGDKEGSIVLGENESGEESSQFRSPFGLSFDLQGNLYVVDLRNHRIQKFEVD